MNKLGKIIKVFLVSAAFFLSISIASNANSALIIDHTCTDLSQVPEYWINQAKDLFKASYGHTSHGSQIVTGMNILKNLYGSLYDFNYSGSGGALSFHDYEPSGDLGNPDRTTWAQRTRDLLDTPGNDRNFIMWSWCGQADTTPENMQIYLDLMSGLEADYPDVTFIYMTGHLNGTGETGNLHQRNNQIRSHVTANNAVLFDFADIESYDPDGNYFLDRGADDGCNYDGGNWADEWCATHLGDDLCTSCSCAHSKPLNCNLKGRAFWWMLARLAGWDPGTSTTTTTADPTDMDGDGIFNDEDNCPESPNGPNLGTCVKTVAGMVVSYRAGDPKDFITCTSDAQCEATDGTCDMAQGNCNATSCGDVCECYANFNENGKVTSTDLRILKIEYGRFDCSEIDPCQADGNEDGEVTGGDLTLLKNEYGRFDCNSY